MERWAGGYVAMDHLRIEARPVMPAFPRSAAPASRLRVCIMTFELLGFWRNGGIGTVSTGLAELLASAGHDVTVAYT
jgi:hypothetical protein